MILCVLAAGCGRPAQHFEAGRVTDPKKLELLKRVFIPEAYVRPEDQRAARRLRDGYPEASPCAYEAVEGGVPVTKSIPIDQCFKMTKPQRWRGLWRNDFEGSRFCPAPARECTWSTAGDRIWLSFGEHSPYSKMQGGGGLYAIDFIGRRTSYPGSYGHMGMSDEQIIVDQFLSIKQIEAPRKQEQ